MRITYILPITSDPGVRASSTATALGYLKETISSIAKQSIPNWELIVCVEKGLAKEVLRQVNSFFSEISELHHSRGQNLYHYQIITKVISSKNNAAACNAALQNAKGKYLAVIQAGDKLAEFTTYTLIECIAKNPNLKFIYTDHDYIDLNGKRHKPFFKPELSPDLLYCQNYVSNLALINKAFLKKLGGWSEKYSAAYTYELNLTVLKKLVCFENLSSTNLARYSQIQHINKILYHERSNSLLNGDYLKHISSNLIDSIKQKQSRQELKVIRDFFKLQGKNAIAKEIKTKLYRHYWKIPKPNPLVSIIIPTRDGYEILKNCIDSILKKSLYKNYEILIVDNQSREEKAIKYMENLQEKHSNIKILYFNKKFNYSAINNFAANHAAGDLLCLVNNDVEVISLNWLNEMVGHAIRPEIGCVGAMLYYKDKSIQHAGVQIDSNGNLNHSFNRLKNIPKNDYFNYLNSISNPLAVTGAALMIKKQLFLEINGFDEKNLPIAFNDVDLCLKAGKISKATIFLPHVELFHHESKSRLIYDEYMKNEKEFAFFRKKWRRLFKKTTNNLEFL